MCTLVAERSWNSLIIVPYVQIQAHVRRHARFVKVASEAPPEDDARKYVQSGEQAAIPAANKEMSKRAAKRVCYTSVSLLILSLDS